MIRMTAYAAVTNDLAPGETVRVNHDDCPAGVDSRRRLYLTRTLANPDALIGYCHNCQTSGYIGNGTKYENYRKDKHDGTIRTTTVTTSNVEAPPHLEPKLGLWPTHALAWAYRGHLDMTLVSKYGIAYDSSSDRVYIPRYYVTADQLTTPRLTGYQLRNTDAIRDVPKYLTVVSDADQGYTVMYGSAINQHQGGYLSTVVLVEDYVSGINVIEAYNGQSRMVHVIVNYGTKVNLEAMYAAAKFPRVLVWLDNDSQHVKDQAKTMSRTIAMMNSQARVAMVAADTDPKHYDHTHIRCIVSAIMSESARDVGKQDKIQTSK